MSDERPPDGPLGFSDDDEDVTPPLETPEGEKESSGNQSYQPRGVPVNTAKYTWFVGIAAIVLIAIVFINTLANGPGPRGVKIGERVPPFAAPLAIGGVVGDVNLATKANEGSAGKVPACSIHKPTVLTVCDAYARKPLVLAFLGTRGKGCIAEVDILAHIATDFPGVEVAAIAIKGDLSDLRKLVVKHGWKFPVAYDRDGQLGNRYGVIVCPQITYVRPGGRSAGTTFGELDEKGLRRRFAALAAGRIVPR
jgi:hypothetical protein